MKTTCILLPILPVLLGFAEPMKPQRPTVLWSQATLELVRNEADEPRDLSFHQPPAAQPIVRSRIKLKTGDIIIPGDDLQKVEAAEGGIITIRRQCSWFSTLPVTAALDEFVRPPEALKENPAFQKLVKEVAPAARGESVLCTLSIAVVHLSEAVLRKPEEIPGGEAAALEKKQAGPIVWNRLLVALCRASSLPAREVHGLLITPGEPKAKAVRRVWIEVLQESEWAAFDPWLSPAPSDDDSQTLEPLLEGGWGQYVPAPLMSLHITVVRGQPDAAQEKFLNSSPEVIECEATKGNALSSDLDDLDAPRLSPFKGLKIKPNSKD